MSLPTTGVDLKCSANKRAQRCFFDAPTSADVVAQLDPNDPLASQITPLAQVRAGVVVAEIQRHDFPDIASTFTAVVKVPNWGEELFVSDDDALANYQHLADLAAAVEAAKEAFAAVVFGSSASAVEVSR